MNTNKTRLNPLEAARLFVAERYPDCDAALLAGSVVRGEATKTSDLDLIIFDHRVGSAYRESHLALDWPIEVFVHNFESYKVFFNNDVNRARPSLPRMVSEGLIIKENDLLPALKEEASSILMKGPERWTQKQIEMKRYFLTDTLDDFIGSTNKAEELFIANSLAELLHEFTLRMNGRWIGSSKWIIRELNRYDANFTDRFVKAFDTFYKTGEKTMVVYLTESVLEPYGGRLFDGFSIR